MKFTFTYNSKDRKQLDRLNHREWFGPLGFAGMWVICFIPTVIGLVVLQLWTILLTVLVLVGISGLVPLLTPKLNLNRREPLRSIELTSVGKRETCGDSTSMLKWKSIDEVFESQHAFLFSRNQRYSLLPKREIKDEQLQPLRDFIAQSRNQPASANEPLAMYRSLFEPAESQQTWRFDLTQADLAASLRSPMLPIEESLFQYHVVAAAMKRRGYGAMFVLPTICLLAVFLIATSIPVAVVDLQFSVGVFSVVAPFVMMVLAAKWLLRKAARKMPYVRDEGYRVRLFAGGWAMGNGDVVAFHGWNDRAIFFLSRVFVGIRTDYGLVNLMPIRGFGSGDDGLGVYNFLARAIELKGQRMRVDSSADTIAPLQSNIPIATVISADDRFERNPYEPPVADSSLTASRDNLSQPDE